jgi:hypothetical protein
METKGRNSDDGNCGFGKKVKCQKMPKVKSSFIGILCNGSESWKLLEGQTTGYVKSIPLFNGL